MSQSSNPDTVMLRAASCIAFSGFLRAGELTAPSEASFDPEVHLCHSCPRMVRLTLKQSKTDPFRQGINIFIGHTGTDLCPVRALLGYLAKGGGETPGPLFQFSDGRYLTRQRFVEEIYALLSN